MKPYDNTFQVRLSHVRFGLQHIQSMIEQKQYETAIHIANSHIETIDELFKIIEEHSKDKDKDKCQ